VFVVLVFSFFVCVGMLGFVTLFVPLGLAFTAKIIGTTAPGEITDKEKFGRKKKRHRVWFRFESEQLPQNGHMDVEPATFDAVKVGDPVTVRFLRTCPEMSATIEEPSLSGSWNDFCGGWFILFWNGGVLLIGGALWRFAIERRNLVRFGTATLGRVTHKQIVSGKTTKFLVSYRFRTLGGAEHDAIEAADKNLYDALEIGHAVAVLHDPDKPDRCVIYLCSEFRIVDLDDKTL